MKAFISIILLCGLITLLSNSCDKEQDIYSKSIIGNWEWMYSYGGFAGANYPEDGQTIRWNFSNDSILVISENGNTTLQVDFHFSGDTLLYQGVTDVKLSTKIYDDTLSLFEYGVNMQSFFKRIN